MSSHLCLTFRFPGGSFHGRRGQGQPEWPPSPLRAFQALLRSAADTRVLGISGSTAALEWLSALPAPTIVAPHGVIGRPRRVAVPNNDGDLLAAAWARRREPSKDANQLKTLKECRACYLPDDSGVHYVWQIPDAAREAFSTHLPTLSTLAAHVVVLGWGVDLAVGHLRVLEADDEVQLLGERWNPADDELAGVPLRVPVNGTLNALIERHEAFCGRLRTGSYTPPPTFSVYRTLHYRRPYDRPPLPVAAFSLLTPDGSAYRPFNAPRRALIVAGLVRGAARSAAEHAGWNTDKVAAFILGHGTGDEPGAHVPAGNQRFAYLPLPTLEQRAADRPPVVSSIRRVLVCGATHETTEEVAWSRRALSGRDLVDEETGEMVALMSAIPLSDPTVWRYVRPASDWTTVTPVVLPGFDDPRHFHRRFDQEKDAKVRRALLDKLHGRVDRLLRKSLVQAGWPQELAVGAELEWRSSGFLPGVELSSRYGTPDHLRRYPRLHVRLRWLNTNGEPIEMPGPLCVGGGRFYGIGLFAPMPPAERDDKARNKEAAQI